MQKIRIKVAISLLIMAFIMSSAVPAMGAEAGTASSISDKAKKSEWPDDNSESKYDIEVPQASTRPQAQVEAPRDREPKSAPGRIVIQYKQSALTPAALTAYGLSPSTTVPGLNVQVLNVSQSTTIQAAIDSLIHDPNVLYAEPDYTVRSVEGTADPLTDLSFMDALAEETDKAPDQLLPNDPLFPDQWGLHNTLNLDDYWYPSIADIDIDAPEAWAIAKDGKDVVVALFDDGIDFNHPELQGKGWINAKEVPNNGIDDDGNGYIDDVNGWDFVHDDNSTFDIGDLGEQGTFSAGIIAAQTNNGIGLAGIAPNAKLMSLKVLSGLTGGGYISDIIPAIAYAKQMGAKIGTFNFISSSKSDILEDAIAEAGGVLFIARAGDSGLSSDTAPNYPGSFDLPNLITVAGIYRGGQIVTNYGGGSVDIAAPGYDIPSALVSTPFSYSAQINTGVYKAIFNGIGYENLGDAKQEIFEKALDYLTEGVEAPSILLVQDDNSSDGDELGEEPSYLTEYKNLLTNAGFTEEGSVAKEPIPAVEPTSVVESVYEEEPAASTAEPSPPSVEPAPEPVPAQPASPTFRTITVNTDAVGPSATEMSGYDAVIWFTGDAHVDFILDEETDEYVDSTPPPLLETDLAQLTDYLNGGGKLILAGPDAVMNNEQSSFFEDVLHLTYMAEGTYGNTLYGVDGSIYAGKEYPFPFRAYADVIASNDPSYATTNLYVDRDDYWTVYGTSPAMSHTAGVAALVLGQYPDKDAVSLKQRLISSGKSLSSLDGLVESGKMIDAYRALTDKDVPGTPFQGPSVTDNLDAESNSDRVYAVDLQAGEKLELTLTGDKDTDFDLYLYSPSTRSVKSKKGIIAYSENVDTSNESLIYTVTESGTYYIDVYAFKGSGSYTLTLDYANRSGLYEDTAPEVAYTGDWNAVTGDHYSDGTAKWLDGPGSVEIAFEGSLIEWKGYVDNEQGLANVYLDGNLIKTMSLYNDKPEYQQTILRVVVPYKHHTLKIEWAGVADPLNKKNSKAAINIDSFVVKRIIEETNIVDGKLYGPWGTNLSVHHSGGAAVYTDIADSYAEYQIEGTYVTLYSYTDDNRGLADIYLDGKLIDTVDMYSEKINYQVPVFESALTEGTHTLKIVMTGDKNAQSSGNTISIDYLELMN